MKIHELLSLSRCGHHAIMNWMFQNLVGFQIEWKFKITNLRDTNVFHINEGNYDSEFSIKFIDENIHRIENLFVSYEDAFCEYTLFRDDFVFRGALSKTRFSNKGVFFSNRIILIRDFYNNLASRLEGKKNKEIASKFTNNRFLFDTQERFVELWKNMAKNIVENRLPYLKYEDWLNNSEIRNSFLLENFGVKETHGINQIVGTKSSFNESKNYTRRFDSNVIPEETKKIIRKDTELHYLIGKMGYEYQKI